jgi:uncharacterized protein YcgI (DUF1989 family)
VSLVTQEMLQTYYNQQRQNLAAAFANQMAQLGLKTTTSQQGEAIKERTLNSKETAAGANTSLGHSQGLGDLRTALANQMQAIAQQKLADTIRYFQQVQTAQMTAAKAGVTAAQPTGTLG